MILSLTRIAPPVDRSLRSFAAHMHKLHLPHPRLQGTCSPRMHTLSRAAPVQNSPAHPPPCCRLPVLTPRAGVGWGGLGLGGGLAAWAGRCTGCTKSRAPRTSCTSEASELHASPPPTPTAQEEGERLAGLIFLRFPCFGKDSSSGFRLRQSSFRLA